MGCLDCTRVVSVGGEIEQEDEFWMNCEGTAMRTCHKFNKDSERKGRVNNATKTSGLTSGKTGVTLFIGAATCALGLFALQAMRMGALGVRGRTRAAPRSAEPL